MAEITLLFHVGFFSILCPTCWNPYAPRVPEDLTKCRKCGIESPKTKRKRHQYFMVSCERLTWLLYIMEGHLYVATSHTKLSKSLLSVGTWHSPKVLVLVLIAFPSSWMFLLTSLSAPITVGGEWSGEEQKVLPSVKSMRWQDNR